MLDSHSHRLLHALTLSLVIHLVMMAGVLSVLPVRPETSAATFKIVLSTDANRNTAPATAPAVPPPPLEKRVPPPAPRAPGMPGPGTRQFVVEKPAVVALPLSASPAASAEPVPAQSALADRPDHSTSALSSAPALTNDAVNADDLRQYRVDLAIAARRFKRYPAQARERGWEGVAEVALAVSAHLPAPEVILIRSSGHPALDRQALEMMTQAARASVLPESLRGRDLRILLPVRFSLEAE